MRTVQGYHGEWNMGSPGGWEYQRTAQLLGKMAWDLISENVEIGVEVDFEFPQISAVPGFARMMLRVHERLHGRNPVHAVLLAGLLRVGPEFVMLDPTVDEDVDIVVTLGRSFVMPN